MPNSSQSEWVTIAQAAVEVRRNRRTVERWLEAGLHSERVRGTRYMRRTDLFARLRLILMTEPEVKTRREGSTKAMS